MKKTQHNFNVLSFDFGCIQYAANQARAEMNDKEYAAYQAHLRGVVPVPA
jgi:hypothetical protein